MLDISRIKPHHDRVISILGEHLNTKGDSPKEIAENIVKSIKSDYCRFEAKNGFINIYPLEPYKKDEKKYLYEEINAICGKRKREEVEARLNTTSRTYYSFNIRDGKDGIEIDELEVPELEDRENYLCSRLAFSIYDFYKKD